jgi:hypothetical protein
MDFLLKELALSGDVIKAIKSDNLTEDDKAIILAYRTEREKFYESKYKGQEIDERALKAATYTEVMRTIRNDARKYIDIEQIKEDDHKVIFQKIIALKDKEIEEVRGDDKTDALKKALQERDDFKTKFNALNSDIETKIETAKKEAEINVQNRIKEINAKEIDRMWEQKVRDPNHKFDKDNAFYVDYLKMQAEKNGYTLVLEGENLKVKKMESGNLVDAYSLNGQTKIEDPNDLIKELSTKLEIYPKSTGEGVSGLTEKILVNGTKIDQTADLALAKELGLVL